MRSANLLLFLLALQTKLTASLTITTSMRPVRPAARTFSVGMSESEPSSPQDEEVEEFEYDPTQPIEFDTPAAPPPPPELPAPLKAVVDAAGSAGDKLQTAAAQAAEDAIAGVQRKLQDVADEVAATPQRIADSAKAGLQSASSNVQAEISAIPDKLGAAIASKLEGVVQDARYPVDVAKAKRDALKAEVQIQSSRLERRLKE